MRPPDARRAGPRQETGPQIAATDSLSRGAHRTPDPGSILIREFGNVLFSMRGSEAPYQAELLTGEEVARIVAAAGELIHAIDSAGDAIFLREGL